MILTETWGEQMRRLRQELGLTQGEVGRIVGVAGETISSWERGDRFGASPESSRLPREVIRKLKKRIYDRDRRT